MRAPERTRLERILAEVRSQRPPAPGEPGLPARLRAELRSTLATPQVAVRAPARQRSRWLPQLALAALLAGAAALVFQRAVFQRAVDPGGALAPAALALLDGQALEVGTLVLATDRPQLVQHAERASWVLAPGSAARLLSASGVLRVGLERGSLEAEVEPSSEPASFAVEAGGTEVVVHGTHFRVALLEGSTHVAVSRGQVEVRPIGQSAGTLLESGMQADFIAGVPRQSVPPPQAGVEAATPPSVEPGPGSGAAQVRPPHVPAPAPLGVNPRPLPGTAQGVAEPKTRAPEVAVPGAAAEQALDAVSAHAQACFRRNLRGSSELGIEASTRLILWVEPNGDLLRADFDPPLAPSVEACVAAELTQLQLSPSPEGYRVERELRLRR